MAELGAILWHAMDGPCSAPELAPWMDPPNTDPIIALSLSRRRLAEYAGAEPIDRRFAFPGDRVWLIEIERPKGDIPGAIGVWRSPGPDGAWRTRCACVWTHGRLGTVTHPLVIGAQWEAGGGHALAGACIVGPSWDEATAPGRGGSRAAALARRQQAIGQEAMARIAMPAARAWLDRHGGRAPAAGRFTPGDAHPVPERTVVPVPGPARTPPPQWLRAEPERTVEAIVLRTAGEGWRVGAACDIAAWRGDCTGWAEMGALAWGAIEDLDQTMDADAWREVERAARERRLAGRGPHRALEATSALVRQMLAQTGRAHVAHAPDERMVFALEVPARLWRALREAGPCPQPTGPAPEYSEHRWLVEIERPRHDEPDALALWTEDGHDVALALFADVDDGQGGACLTAVTWRTNAAGEHSGAGLATLRYPVHVDDPAHAKAQAQLQHVVEMLAAPHTGPVARARAAIALHLSHTHAPAPLGPYRASQASERAARRPGSGAREAAFPRLFAVERAPEPIPSAPNTQAPGGHRSADRGALVERHTVRAHWKRQAHGTSRTKRRWIVIEGYERGPTPAQDEITLRRLAEGELDRGTARRAATVRRRSDDMTSILKRTTTALAMAGALALGGCQATQTRAESDDAQSTQPTTVSTEEPTSESAPAPEPQGVSSFAGHWSGAWQGGGKSTLTVAGEAPDGTVEYCFKGKCWEISNYEVDDEGTLKWSFKGSWWEWRMKGEKLRGKLTRSQGRIWRVTMKRK